MTIKLNGWTKFIILAITALIGIGIYITTIKANTERGKTHEMLIHINTGDIRELKTDIKYIRTGVDDLRGIKNKE